MSDIANDRLQSLSRLDSAATTQLGSTTLLSSTSSYVKVLNLRQRKWNSAQLLYPRGTKLYNHSGMMDNFHITPQKTYLLHIQYSRAAASVVSDRSKEQETKHGSITAAVRWSSEAHLVNYNGEEGRLGHFSHTSQPIQPSHGATGMANTHQQQHPWMALSMTSLDGTMNIPSDRFSRNPSSALSSAAASSMSTVSSSIAPAPPVSSSAPLSFSTGVRQDEPSNNWNQQLLKSHSGYRENYGGAMPRHGSYSRASPVHYGQHTYQQHFQHGHAHNHSFEDVSMGDETSRPMPSRSSSPAPCLSMVPTITRPLSISFSHLAGPNTLGNVSEHEHDDDMEL
ncbi:hypothetical protein EDD11_009796 [Mortierella claussenii]|nr:hypothetical protein EDD11_009796 [Mortierella claussenii]